MSDKKEIVVAYKALDKDLKCRDYQFEIGKTYKHDGDVKICQSGFHSCLNPFDVLSYYNLTDSRFAIVEAVGEIKIHEDDSKIASAEITIKAELKLPEFVKKCVDFLLNAASGNYSQLAASGNYSQLAASGDYSRLAASGNSSQLAASGDYSQLAASGNYSQLAASGDYSQLAASGDYSRLAASGNYSRLAASGNYSRLAASGDYSQLAASGDYSQLAASGDYSQLAASGDDSRLAASGNYSRLAASGNFSRLAASGDSSIACNAGVNGRVKGGNKCAMSLAYWNSGENRYRIVVAYVGEKGIKPDTWYKLDENNNFSEVKE